MGMEASILSILLLLSTLLETIIGAVVSRKDSRLLGNCLYALAFVTAVAGLASIYNDNRRWDLSEIQTKELKKFACTTLPKFPFYVFDLGSVSETTTYAVHIRDAFRSCGWPVSLYPGDGYLRQDEVGVAVVISPGNAKNENIKNMAHTLSRSLCIAGVSHILGTHTRLDETTVRIGIVVRKRPDLLQHFQGYGVQCNVPR